MGSDETRLMKALLENARSKHKEVHAPAADVCGLLLAPAPASSGQEERPVLRVGTEGTYPPFSFKDPDTDELTGYDVAVMEAVA